MVADNETEEGLALAIAMRETLETPGKTAALVTPDPSIVSEESQPSLPDGGSRSKTRPGGHWLESPAGVQARLDP